jgi:hypothetical protein
MKYWKRQLHEQNLRFIEEYSEQSSDLQGYVKGGESFA